MQKCQLKKVLSHFTVIRPGIVSLVTRKNLAWIDLEIAQSSFPSDEIQEAVSLIRSLAFCQAVLEQKFAYS